ncbi:Importin-9 [Fasciolopsis buskii]|uniref:Importin-9 n=1 Tax=Fasciolopsis buskii TaxID=27845 RepID=A0A8E0RQS0_9TREM|nr:Importin-9 [Fasciolopsis buski]
MDASTTAVMSAFSIVLGQQEGDRRLAEQNLIALEVLDSYPVILVNLIADEQLAVEVRQLAGVTLKRYVLCHWSSNECSDFTPPAATEEAKLHVRVHLLRCLSSPVRLVRNVVTHTIATIAQFDWPEAWPTLLPDISQMITRVAQLDQSNLPAVEQNKALVHGCIRVLAAISGEISDLDVPKVAPLLMPSLMRVICDKQRFGRATRRNAVIAVNNLLDTMLSSGDQDAFNQCFGCHIRPCMNYVLAELTASKLSLEESSFHSELIQMLTYLCAEVRGFVDSCFGGEWTPLMNMLWQLLLRTTDAYVQWKVIPRSGAGDGEELEGADAVDSDGETIDYDTLVCTLIEFLSRLTGIKRCRTKLVPHLSNLCFQLARLMQLPRAVTHQWLNNLEDFIEDSDESLGCCVRLTILDLIRRLPLRFNNWYETFHVTIARLFTDAQEQHKKGDPSWWTLLEVALYLCGTFPRCFNPRKLATPNKDTAVFSIDVIVSRYVIPSLQQTDYPLLQVAALHCVSEVAVHSIPNGPRLEDLPGLLIGALSSTQHPVVRASAVHELCSAGTKLRQLVSTTTANVCPDLGTGHSTAFLLSQLPNLVTGVVDCLSQFGEPVLIDGLDALCGLLRIDPQGFTTSIRAQITSLLVELFKHCFGVAGTLSLYLDVLRTLCQASTDQSNEIIEQAFMPTLITCLEQPGTVDTVAIEAALQLLCVLIETSHQTVSSLLIQRLFPVVVHIAITSSDSMVISGCCEALRCYLAVGVNQVLDWHDDEGNNGIGYILHVTSRLLDPTGPVEHATAGGRLVCGILMRLQSHQLGENLDLLLRGALARLSNLPLFVNTPGTTQLDDGLNSGSVRGARQSLVFVFVLLFRLQPEVALHFLASVPDLNGLPVMATVLRLWCSSQPFYFAQAQVRISIFALSNLLTHAIATKDERLMQITLSASEVEQVCPSDPNTAARTRSKSQALKTSELVDCVVLFFVCFLFRLVCLPTHHCFATFLLY